MERMVVLLMMLDASVMPGPGWHQRHMSLIGQGRIGAMNWHEERSMVLKWWTMEVGKGAAICKSLNVANNVMFSY